MRGLVCTIGYESMDIRELFYYVVINIVKYNTVMYIARGNFYCQNNSADIAGCMGFITKALRYRWCPAGS